MFRFHREYAATNVHRMFELWRCELQEQGGREVIFLQAAIAPPEHRNVVHGFPPA